MISLFVSSLSSSLPSPPFYLPHCRVSYLAGADRLPTLLPHNTRPASSIPAMDEKASLQDLPRENLVPTSSKASPTDRKSSTRGWFLLLGALLAGGWFLWPHYCHHIGHTRVLTIEDRVQHILSTTPLIGMIARSDV